MTSTDVICLFLESDMTSLEWHHVSQSIFYEYIPPTIVCYTLTTYCHVCCCVVRLCDLQLYNELLFKTECWYHLIKNKMYRLQSFDWHLRTSTPLCLCMILIQIGAVRLQITQKNGCYLHIWTLISRLLIIYTNMNEIKHTACFNLRNWDFLFGCVLLKMISG